MSRWDVQPEDYAERLEPETFVHPMQGVAYMADKQSSISLFSKGLYEMEVTDNEEKAMILTLMRSHSHEQGTVTATDSKMLRSLTFEYAVSFGCSSPADALARGEQYRAPILAQAFVPNPQAEMLPPQDTMLGFEGEGKMLSGIYQNNVCKEIPENAALVRFYDVSGEAGSVRISLRRPLKGACLLNLDGDILEELSFDENSLDVPCGAYQIVTAALY